MKRVFIFKINRVLFDLRQRICIQLFEGIMDDMEVSFLNTRQTFIMLFSWLILFCGVWGVVATNNMAF